MPTVILTIDYNEQLITVQTLMDVSRGLVGVHNVAGRMINEYPDSRHWEKCTAEKILETIHRGPKYGDSDFSSEVKAEILVAKRDKRMIPIIKIIRTLSGMDLKSAKDWTESFFNTP